MHYKSLYRKYRPTDFESVFGQDHIVKSLETSIKKDIINHAYLFSGERGTGKTTVAKIFAKTVNCVNLKDGKVCEKCDICKKEIDEIQDIIEIDAASNNGVDEIREIKNKVNLVPSSCKYKVYIIDEVHMLSIGAFNALLKTLEEPPKHVIFILATTEINKMPTTIISRCQRYDFKKINVEKMVERLKYISKKENIELEEGVLEEIAKISDGSLRDSIGVLEQLNTYSDGLIKKEHLYDITGIIDSKDIFEFVENIVKNNSKKILEKTEIFNNLGKDFEKISEQIFLILREVLLLKKAPTYFENKKNVEYKNIKKISEEVEEKELINLIKDLNECIYEMKRSSYPNLIFEVFLLKNISIDEKETKEKKELKQVECKEEIKKEPQNSVKEYKNILINNTLSLAKKECIKEFNEILKECDKYLVNKKYKEVANLLMDAKVAAASDHHVFLTYEHDSLVENHDNELKKIENLIKEISEKKYKIVALTEKEWKKKRPYYVEIKKTQKEIKLLEETEVIPMKREERYILIDNAIDMFGEEIIETEG